MQYNSRYGLAVKPPRKLRWLKRLGLALLAAVALLALVIGGARLLSALRTRISSPTGIQEGVYVKAGGILQYLQIRGQDAANPVILSVHGGPGSPMTPLSYIYQTGLEADYTIVQWEQRGSGRTYYENKGSPQPALSAELVLRDMDDVVEYLRVRFGHGKIIVLGHSWGTVLGSLYAQAHPEKVAAFVSVSQVVDMREGALLAASAALERATEQGNAADMGELTVLIGQLNGVRGADSAFQALLARAQKFAGQYMAYDGQYRQSDALWPGLTSPDLSVRDLRWFSFSAFDSQGHARLEEPLLRACCAFDAYADTTYQVPVYFIAGQNDWVTPHPLIEAYYEAVEAPDKRIVSMEGIGHSPQLESPARFCAAVLRMLDRL